MSDTSEVSHRSSRDLEAVRVALAGACAARWPAGDNHRVENLEGTSATGMSSETLLFDLLYDESGKTKTHRLVARVAPDAADVPVFPSYDMVGQFRTIETVAESSDVPVPPPLWCEPDAGVIGSPFFVMGRVDGEVPPDVMPYNFGDSWLFHASPQDQSRLQESSVSVLTRLHDIDEPLSRFAHLVPADGGDTALRRHVAGRRAWYEWSSKGCGPSELVEKGFEWLDEHWPAHEGDPVFCWGDSRIGNVMYRDFEPVAVLDWEMAGVGPRELDVGWMVYCHRMFEDMASDFGFAGMPHFLRAEEVAATYEKLSGYSPRDLHWYITYSCLQLSIVFMRTGWRQVHFGDRPMPGSTEELLMNASTLRSLIS